MRGILSTGYSPQMAVISRRSWLWEGGLGVRVELGFVLGLDL